jgi:hypothetical protein
MLIEYLQPWMRVRAFEVADLNSAAHAPAIYAPGIYLANQHITSAPTWLPHLASQHMPDYTSFLSLKALQKMSDGLLSRFLVATGDLTSCTD